MTSARWAPWLILPLTVAGWQVAWAEELTWKDANRRSAEALRSGNDAEGARLAQQAFELYASQSPTYKVENHAQLLLNAVDARARLGWRGALHQLDDGAKVIEAKAGASAPALVSLWEEGIRISQKHHDEGLVEHYYERGAKLAETIWGRNDPRTISLIIRRANDLRRDKGYNWARRELDRAQQRLAESPSEPLEISVDMARARMELESKRPAKAIALFRAVIDRLEARGDAEVPVILQSAYAQLEYACQENDDEVCATDARKRLQASFGNADELVPLARVVPRYPTGAARHGQNGAVELKLVVAADGTVKDVTVIASSPEGVFDEAAVEAVHQWKFRPRVVNGQPREQTGLQRIDFTLAPHDPRSIKALSGVQSTPKKRD